MKYISFCLLLLLSSMCTLAQERQFEIKGKVVDLETNEGLKNAIIEVADTVILTDSSGAFSYLSSTPTPTLIVSHVTHQPAKTITPTKKNFNQLSIALPEKKVVLNTGLYLGEENLKRILTQKPCPAKKRNDPPPAPEVTQAAHYPSGNACIEYLFAEQLLPAIQKNKVLSFGELSIMIVVEASGKAKIVQYKGQRIPEDLQPHLNAIAKAMTDWKPAKQMGEKVTSRFIYELGY